MSGRKTRKALRRLERQLKRHTAALESLTAALDAVAREVRAAETAESSPVQVAEALTAAAQHSEAAVKQAALERQVNEHVTAWLSMRGLRDADARPLWQDIAEDLWRSDRLRRLANHDRRLLEGRVTLDIQRRLLG